MGDVWCTWWQIFRGYNMFVLALTAGVQGFCKITDDDQQCHRAGKGVEVSFFHNLHQSLQSDSAVDTTPVPGFDIFVFVSALVLNEMFMSRIHRRILRCLNPNLTLILTLAPNTIPYTSPAPHTNPNLTQVQTSILINATR